MDNIFLNKEHIIENRIPINKSKEIGCVYFLLDGEEIVYVGSTMDFLGRMSTHLRNDKQFDSYFEIACEKEILTDLEAYYIVHHDPKYNKPPLPANLFYKTVSGLKTEYKIMKPEIKNILRDHQAVVCYYEYFAITEAIKTDLEDLSEKRNKLSTRGKVSPEIIDLF